MRKYTLFLVAAILVVAGVAVNQSNAQEGDNATCREPLEVVASVLGLDETAVTEALENNQTLAELAETQGVSAAELAEALADNMRVCQNERLDLHGAEVMCMMIEGPRIRERISPRIDDIRWNIQAAEALELDVMDVVTRDISIAELAENAGVDPADVVATIVDNVSAEVYRHVETELLSDEDAQEILSTLQDDVTEFVNVSPAESQPINLLDVAQETIGLESTDFYQALVDGQTLADLAANNDVDLEDLKAALLEAATTNLERAQAEGWVSDCVAEVRLSHLSDLVDNYINRENPGETLFEGGFGFSSPMGRVEIRIGGRGGRDFTPFDIEFEGGPFFPGRPGIIIEGDIFDGEFDWPGMPGGRGRGRGRGRGFPMEGFGFEGFGPGHGWDMPGMEFHFEGFPFDPDSDVSLFPRGRFNMGDFDFEFDGIRIGPRWWEDGAESD